jgi:hypothetical protein
MSTITVRDLDQTRELDHSAMSAVRGGSFGLSELRGPFANVNVAVNQNIVQLQNIGVNVLNGNGVIGFVPDLNLNVSGKQWARAGVVF